MDEFLKKLELESKAQEKQRWTWKERILIPLAIAAMYSVFFYIIFVIYNILKQY